MGLAINPETRVGPMLDQYPALEAVLISMAPAFEKLKNPMMRRTVGKVATLAQAARVGGVPVDRMVRELRAAAGQSEPALAVMEESIETEPAWLGVATLREEIDGDEMLAGGVHPIGRVRSATAALGPGEMVRLRTSFRPEPLIETMRRAGFEVYSAEMSPGRHLTHFARH